MDEFEVEENKKIEEGNFHSLEMSPVYPVESINRGSLNPEKTENMVRLDAKNIYLQERHVMPIIWTRSALGYRIQDLGERQYFDVTTLIKKYIIPTDPLLKTIVGTSGEDEYLEAITKWYPATQSLVALKEGSKEVIGVLIGRRVVEPDWFDSTSKIEFVKKVDKYEYLKTTQVKDGGPGKDLKSGSLAKGNRKSVTGGRKSMKGGSRKSMGARKSKVGSRKSMGGSPKSAGGSRKSMGGSRKSMGGSRKSTGGSRKSMGGSRKSTGGSRKSMGGSRKSVSGRKSMGGSRKSVSGRKSMGAEKSPKRGKMSLSGNRPTERKRDWKVPRPVDIVPEEEVPIVQPAVFDDDGVKFTSEELQYCHTFKQKLANKINIWKLLKQKTFYRVYLVVVPPKFLKYDVENALFESLKNMCRAFDVSVVAGLLTTYSSQNAFYHAGGLIVYEELYKRYPKFEPKDPRSYDRSATFGILDMSQEQSSSSNLKKLSFISNKT